MRLFFFLTLTQIALCCWSFGHTHRLTDWYFTVDRRSRASACPLPPQGRAVEVLSCVSSKCSWYLNANIHDFPTDSKQKFHSFVPLNIYHLWSKGLVTAEKKQGCFLETERHRVSKEAFLPPPSPFPCRSLEREAVFFPSSIATPLILRAYFLNGMLWIKCGLLISVLGWLVERNRHLLHCQHVPPLQTKLVLLRD